MPDNSYLYIGDGGFTNERTNWLTEEYQRHMHQEIARRVREIPRLSREYRNGEWYSCFLDDEDEPRVCRNKEIKYKERLL